MLLPHIIDNHKIGIMRIVELFLGIKTMKKKLPSVLEPEEAKKLLEQPSEGCFTGLRNKTMMSLMLHCGLRLAETICIKPGDIDTTKAKLRIKEGKGCKDRDLGIPEYLNEVLKRFEKIRPKGDYFFTTCKGGKVCRRYIQAMVERYAQTAGIKKRVSPHTLRHTFATEYYRQTKDIETLRRILGHESISTTQIYITLSNIEVENGMKAFKGFT